MSIQPLLWGNSTYKSSLLKIILREEKSIENGGGCDSEGPKSLRWFTQSLHLSKLRFTHSGDLSATLSSTAFRLVRTSEILLIVSQAAMSAKQSFL